MLRYIKRRKISLPSTTTKLLELAQRIIYIKMPMYKFIVQISLWCWSDGLCSLLIHNAHGTITHNVLGNKIHNVLSNKIHHVLSNIIYNVSVT